jgi:hypothetical protein
METKYLVIYDEALKSYLKDAHLNDTSYSQFIIGDGIPYNSLPFSVHKGFELTPSIRLAKWFAKEEELALKQVQLYHPKAKYIEITLSGLPS